MTVLNRSLEWKCPEESFRSHRRTPPFADRANQQRSAACYGAHGPVQGVQRSSCVVASLSDCVMPPCRDVETDTRTRRVLPHCLMNHPLGWAKGKFHHTIKPPKQRRRLHLTSKKPQSYVAIDLLDVGECGSLHPFLEVHQHCRHPRRITFENLAWSSASAGLLSSLIECSAARLSWISEGLQDVPFVVPVSLSRQPFHRHLAQHGPRSSAIASLSEILLSMGLSLASLE